MKVASGVSGMKASLLGAVSKDKAINGGEDCASLEAEK